MGIVQRRHALLEVLDELLSLPLAQSTSHALLDCSDRPVAGAHQLESFRREVRSQHACIVAAMSLDQPDPLEVYHHLIRGLSRDETTPRQRSSR